LNIEKIEIKRRLFIKVLGHIDRQKQRSTDKSTIFRKLRVPIGVTIDQKYYYPIRKLFIDYFQGGAETFSKQEIRPVFTHFFYF